VESLSLGLTGIHSEAASGRKDGVYRTGQSLVTARLRVSRRRQLSSLGWGKWQRRARRSRAAPASRSLPSTSVRRSKARFVVTIGFCRSEAVLRRSKSNSAHSLSPYSSRISRSSGLICLRNRRSWFSSLASLSSVTRSLTQERRTFRPYPQAAIPRAIARCVVPTPLEPSSDKCSQSSKHYPSARPIPSLLSAAGKSLQISTIHFLTVRATLPRPQLFDRRSRIVSDDCVRVIHAYGGWKSAGSPMEK
jgi:hypothetical protein